MLGFKKKRSKYGQFLDEHKILQEEVSRISGLNRDTVSDACSNPEYRPRKSTMNLLVMAVKELTGKSVKSKDFWG